MLDFLYSPVPIFAAFALGCVIAWHLTPRLYARLREHEPGAAAVEACAPGVDAEAAARISRWLERKPVEFDLVHRPDGFRYIRPRAADHA